MAGVVLQGLPLRLFYAWEEHSDALLREYALVVGPEHPYSLGDVARARAARVAVSQVVRYEEGEGERPAAGNYQLTLPAAVEPADFSMLQAVLEAGNDMARTGAFLTLPSLPEVAALRDWVCEQVVRQASGEEPTPWETDAASRRPEAPLTTWTGAAKLPPQRPWLVGDGHNRIIAASPAAQQLLHWGEDLVGQRILAVIPPHLREAHIAGFTHASVTGEHRLLGQVLHVSAWTRDGHEVPITLTLERQPAPAGTAIYIAWIEDARGDPSGQARADLG